MKHHLCQSCGTKYDSDERPDVCECGGKLIDSRVAFERAQQEQDRIEEMWAAYYAVKEFEEAQATYNEGALLRRQAG